jgi:hypothetical protein
MAMHGANPQLKGKYIKEKTIERSFGVNSDALLLVENCIGNLHITSWDQNKTIIEVHIQTSSDNEKKAQKKLDQIGIAFQGSRSMVKAQTIYDKNISWSDQNVSMQVNYTIKVPVNNTLELDNEYGTIYLNQINGNTKIKCKYGSMQIGRLNGPTNELSFDYCSDVSFDYIKNAVINADYSEFYIQEATRIYLESDYSQSKLAKVEDIDFDCEYGEISLENATNVRGDGEYLDIEIGSVYGDVNLSSDYGDIEINELTQKAGNLTITADYTDVAIGFNSSYPFDLIAELSYANLRGFDDFEYTIKREKSSSSYYEGYYGNKGENTVKLDIEYGGLKMIKH